MKIYCQNCSKLFIPKEKRIDRPSSFCSRICGVKYRSGERHPRFKDGCIADGYHQIRRQVKGRSKPLKAHRVIMEEILGRKLKSTEHIHHIDHNKLNNDPSNLMIVSIGEHSRIHGSFRNETHKECARCHVVKERRYFSKQDAKLINHDPHRAYCKLCVCLKTQSYHNEIK